jgi:hypothetical protein
MLTFHMITIKITSKPKVTISKTIKKPIPVEILPCAKYCANHSFTQTAHLIIIRSH